MAIPTSKSTFKSYCLRALGFGVIDINVSDDQADDRIDEALQYFAQYHYDGVERVYLKYQVTQADKDRILSPNGDSTITATKGSVTSTYKQANNYIIVPETVLAVTRIFPLSSRGNQNMFDVRYQLRLNDLYDFSSTSIIHYDMVMRHLDMLDHILVGEKPIDFNMHNNRLYIGMDWKTDIQVGEYLVIECYRKLDPTENTDVFNDMYLKRYVTSLFKKQWGTNLSKFGGVQMIGGVTLNGLEIYQQANQEIQTLEDQIRGTFESPVTYMVG